MESGWMVGFSKAAKEEEENEYIRQIYSILTKKESCKRNEQQHANPEVAKDAMMQ